MTTRTSLLILPFLLAALFCAWPVQPAGAAPKKILIIETQTTEPYVTITAAMLKTLAERYAEGRDIEIDRVSIGQHVGEAGNIWKYHDGAHAAVVYVAGTIAAQAMAPFMRAEPQVPFVFASVTDPVGLGLIGGFGTRPQANVTGVSFPPPVKERLRFIRRVMPNVRTIGLVYGDMPQSNAYRDWLERLLAQDPEFKDLRILFRKVDFVAGDNGTRRMAMRATAFIHELDPQVDLFLAPNDQMGINPAFANMVVKTASKPLVGIIEPDAREGWGATMTYYPSLTGMGRQAGRMITRLLDGEPLAAMPAETPKDVGVAFDWSLVARFGLTVPADLAALSKKTEP